MCMKEPSWMNGDNRVDLVDAQTCYHCHDEIDWKYCVTDGNQFYHHDCAIDFGIPKDELIPWLYEDELLASQCDEVVH